VVGLIEVVPWAAAVLTATEPGLMVPTGSLSLPSTEMVTGWFWGVDALSAVATGGASTVTLTVAGLEVCPSVLATVYLNVSVPENPAVGV